MGWRQRARGLDPPGHAGRGVHHGLVVHLDGVGAEALFEVLPDHQRGRRPRSHRRPERSPPPLARLLGRVHGEVGVGHQFLDPSFVITSRQHRGDADWPRPGDGRRPQRGSSKGATTSPARRSASADSPDSSRSTANSSPPTRATVSEARKRLVSRSATPRRSSSPAAWPRASFTILKSSRSTKAMAMPAPYRRCRRWATVTRSGTGPGWPGP